MFNKIKYAIRDIFPPKKGSIDFTSGEYEIFVHSRSKDHESVEYDLEEFEESICGFCPHNHFHIEKNQNGFLLKANVESGKIKFHWRIK